ncbi:hypothetical protein [Streptomyces sp. NPDC050485]|uniref:hypothetical protein n=1 Tax=Streptomyces sp. NPDC050485 TaxID=3365617 RepID=UPI0037B7AA63
MPTLSIHFDPAVLAHLVKAGGDDTVHVTLSPGGGDRGSASEAESLIPHGPLADLMKAGLCRTGADPIHTRSSPADFISAVSRHQLPRPAGVSVSADPSSANTALFVIAVLLDQAIALPGILTLPVPARVSLVTSLSATTRHGRWRQTATCARKTGVDAGVDTVVGRIRSGWHGAGSGLTMCPAV